VNFLVDAQLPPALARWIGERGHRAAHVLEAGLQAAQDDPIWEHARKTKAIIISKDEDFVDRWLLSAKPVPLIWIRKGNCSNRALLEWLEPLWPDALKRLDQGERLIELRA
jgi:predicted nuclease of predicted toxin-antitoxin system